MGLATGGAMYRVELINSYTHKVKWLQLCSENR